MENSVKNEFHAAENKIKEEAHVIHEDIDSSIIGDLQSAVGKELKQDYHKVQHELQREVDDVKKEGLGKALSRTAKHELAVVEEEAGEIKHKVQQEWTDDVVDPLEQNLGRAGNKIVDEAEELKDRFLPKTGDFEKLGMEAIVLGLIGAYLVFKIL